MNSLSMPDAFHLDAAEGWILLGDAHEAIEELDKIDIRYRHHPEVLNIRWHAYAALDWWDPAWATARLLCQVAPDEPQGWICQANALRECKGLRDAKNLLLEVVHRFPDEPVMRFNLACYFCQLGRMNECCQWLLKALEIDDSVEFKLQALSDPDLKPLWNKIGEPIQLDIPTGVSDT